ncbi:MULTISPECIES: hypothetical protein [unclassified Pseudomonas]|uniref:hypothetical protein n=1 Tax=unclassified Pseudomonas TaxID=196821 RepID=UPI000BC417E1|nr:MULTISPECIES: hypothetical protein [unclassified Pseudomonas]PVZ19647.1 hypothetical protein F474_00236 [Pseudomonas sp. URIL14HWK12:I12]PVZ22768.1 hypothetical protein F470_03264 [Pseudomonas sp. URIL14HWK12:I10]PVZ37602.1 hypothetical protein F472_00236 [Pseudomonas sp. URIL14HWK12:I11]SNZ15229.1 hypothetical protein SAMN05660463_03030 [Pseudomonas sp. URIL14HWK12:I9]
MEAGVSLELAELLSGHSLRTWWRRLARGQARRLPGNDTRGRARLALSSLWPCLPDAQEPLDAALLLAADQGNAQAQVELGQWLVLAGRSRSALALWEAAAKQGHAGAMQLLAMHHLPLLPCRAVMWLARAAEAGDPIGQAQFLALFPKGSIGLTPLK